MTRGELLIRAQQPGLQPGEIRRLQENIEEYTAGDDTDCGGYGFNPPCGGCSRCICAQLSYHAHEDAKRRSRRALIGLLSATNATQATVEEQIGKLFHKPSTPIWEKPRHVERGP